MKMSGTARTISQAFDFAEDPANENKPFLVGPRSITYGRLANCCRRLTRVFFDAGLKPKDRVIVSSRDDVQNIVVFLSLLRNGITAVVVNPGVKPHRFSAIFDTARPAGMVLDKKLKELWQVEHRSFTLEIDDASSGRPKNLFDKLMVKGKTKDQRKDRLPGLLDDVLPMDGPRRVDPESDAYVLFTSGTTSQPKGVRISQRNLFSHLATMSRLFGYDSATRLLNVLPLSHTDGLIHGPVTAFANGAALYRPVEFEIHNIPALLDSIYTNRITHFIAVPTMLSLIDRLGPDYRDCFSTDDFCFIISSASPLEASVWRRFEENFSTRIVNVYGLTETVVGGLFAGPDDGTRKIGTVGKPADCEVRIVDENGVDAARGQPGELMIKGENVFQGYLNDAAATAEVLKDGWFKTGDLFLQDEGGFYSICGRKKSLIISGGVNVHPEEVTEVLNRAQDVQESVTFAEPDETWGEQVVSCAVLEKGSTVTQQDLISWLREHLEPAKVPVRIHILDSLPRTASGKVIVSQVKRKIQDTRGSRRKTDRSGLLETIVGIAASCFKVPSESLGEFSSPADTEVWDSLAHLGLVAAVEEHFSIHLSTAEIMQIENLSDLVEIVSAKRCRDL